MTSIGRSSDRATALSAVMVPVRRIGFLVMPAHNNALAGSCRTDHVQRAVLVSDVSKEFKPRFRPGAQKQESNRHAARARNS
jgi:hypothetical protein